MQEYLIGALAGLLLAVIAGFWQRGRWLARAARDGERIAGLTAALDAARQQTTLLEALRGRQGEALAAQQARIAELDTLLRKEGESAAEKLALLAQAESALANAFKSLSGEALRHNNQAFLDLARQSLGAFQASAQGELAARLQAVDGLVAPIHKALEQLDGQTRALEQTRARDFGELGQQLRGLALAQHDLRQETARLVTALRRPEVRGRWGEVQLRRVVELAGMLEHCDFFEQESAADGRRPDMLVRLPGGKHVVLDAKAPLGAYLEAMEAEHDEARGRALERYARHVRTHVQQLAAKAYWEQFSPSPEFVVLFLPGESFFSAALREDPELIEYAGERKVILATPSTLLAMLKTVFHGWRQEALAENARQVSELGGVLYERLAKLGEHWNMLGKHLGMAVKAYNEASGSLESRVLVTARRFEVLRVTPEGASLPTPQLLEQTVRAPQAPELLVDSRSMPARDGA